MGRERCFSRNLEAWWLIGKLARMPADPVPGPGLSGVACPGAAGGGS
jgi:hypothetical protein